ncbi:MAG TPA: ABATE domain-containing protein [Gemmatimonadales bacterium]|nr:ABATE domain-containing protein [Gemmatimonadales bacterium]
MSSPEFFFLANLLCLDLVNTEPMRDGERVDLLEGFAGLTRWLREAGVLPEESARRAAERWGRTGEGEAVLVEAKALRAALRAGAERLAAGRPAGPGLVRAVNRILAARPTYRRLERRGEAVVSRLEPVSESPLQLLAPVAESAAWVLEYGDLSLVRRCDGNRCVLFFYDTTRNRSRRWCSMEGCGSRAKAGAYYRRQHPPR